MTDKPMNPYLEKLIDIKMQDFHDLKEIGDQWRTPDLEFCGIENYVTNGSRFVIDLFTDGQNSKCDHYYSLANNALVQDWHGDALKYGGAGAWCYGNPPYSRPFEYDDAPYTGMINIMKKVKEERDKGANICLLTKHAPSESWWPDELTDFQVDTIINIKGRITFQLPVWANGVKPQSSGFASSLLIFSRHFEKMDPGCAPPVIAMLRDELRRLGQERFPAFQEDRRVWIASFDEL